MKNRKVIPSWPLYALAAALLLAAPAARSQQEPGGEPSQKPSLALQPESGYAGTSIAVTGAEFRASCGVNLFFGDTYKREASGFARVEKDGTFRASITAPMAAAAGEQPVTAQGLRVEDNECSEPSGESARAEFTLLPAPPTLTMDAFEGRPGEMVTLLGSGFCAKTGCSTVRLMIDGQVVADEVAVRADGTLSVQARVPAIEVGPEVLVEAVQTMSGGEEIRAEAELTVAVRPNVNPEGPR